MSADRQGGIAAGDHGRLVHLDMLRGVAALLVLIGHVRSFVLLDYGQSAAPLLAAPFYLVTGLGHQAVIVFFALSGFLVGGRALREIAERRWQVSTYVVHRLARLWTALIPALIATALLDWLGRDLLHLPGYDGRYAALLMSGPAAGDDATTLAATLAAFVGNLLFLQTIAVPVFGSNGPLWSLANEFWYYLVVPGAWLALTPGGARPPLRFAACLFVIAAVFLLPRSILALGSIWLLGALAWLLSDAVRDLPGAWFAMVLSIACVAVAVGVAATVGHPGLPGDLLLGAGIALSLPCLARLPSPGGLYRRLAIWSSDISFTLYVVHFPLLALLWFAFCAPRQFTVAPTALAAFAALMAAALAYAAAMWWLFERNTPHVRRWLSAQFRIAPR